MKAGNATNFQEFSPHPITTGLNQIYEGATICYPSVISMTRANDFGDLKVIGRGSDGWPSIMVKEADNQGKLVIDCGFTKLMSDYWVNVAGTSRYVSNSAAWLLIDERKKQQ